MLSNKVIQIMPITTDSSFDCSSRQFLMASEDGKHNTWWYVAGAALMETGKVLPIIWDGVFEFKTLDPDDLRLLAIANRAIKHINDENKDRHVKRVKDDDNKIEGKNHE